MSTSLVLYGQGMVVHPLTGETLALDDATTDTLAGVLNDIRYHESQLRELKNVLADELHQRLDRHATLTWRGGGYEVKGQGATTTEYDAEGLASDLRELVRDGVIDKAAAEKAVSREVVYKASANGVKALLRTGNPRLREVVERHSSEVENPVRRVSVKRLG